MIQAAFKPFFFAFPVFLGVMLFVDAGGQTTISFGQDNRIVLYRMPPLPVSASVSGRIYTEIGTAVPFVNLNYVGTDAGATSTDANGFYFINLDDEGSYAVVPSRYNDTTITNGVSTIDLLLIRQHILSTMFLNSPYKIIAGDVDGSGSVSTIDYLLVRAVILRISSAYPSGKTWVFVKSDFAFANPGQPFPYQDFRAYNNITNDYQNQDFIGIKLGDVNNSWDPNAPKMSAAGEIQFEFDNTEAQQGEEVVIPVKVKKFDRVSGYQFTVSWNPQVLSLLDVSNKALDGCFGLNGVSTGYLTANWIDESGRAVSVDDHEATFELKYKVIGNSGDFSDIKISSDVTAAEAYSENLEPLNIVSKSGKVKVGTNNSVSGDFQFSVFPNPFQDAIEVSFFLDQDENVKMLMYDVNGKQVAGRSDFLPAGVHQWICDEADFSGSRLPRGIYYLNFTAGQISTVAKLMRID